MLAQLDCHPWFFSVLTPSVAVKSELIKNNCGVSLTSLSMEVDMVSLSQCQSEFIRYNQTPIAWDGGLIALLYKTCWMTWMHKYKGINWWTLRWIVCVSFVPKPTDYALRVCVLLLPIPFMHCDCLLMVQDLSKQQKLFIRSSKKIGMIQQIFVHLRFTALGSQLASWGQSISVPSQLCVRQRCTSEISENKSSSHTCVIKFLLQHGKNYVVW